MHLAMNDRLKLNGPLIRDFLKKEYRFRRYLVVKLEISDSLVNRMLSKEGYVPRRRQTLSRLAELMGVGVSDLLLPRDEQAA